MLNNRRWQIPVQVTVIVAVVTGLILIWTLLTHVSLQGLSGTNVMVKPKENASQINDIATHVSDEQCVKRLPSAIVVGIQKSGTTTLLRFLKDHPQIVTAMGGTGEPHYFSKHYDKPLELFRHMMPCSYPNQTTMEKTPDYFFKPEVPERIWNMNPNTKIIIIVKEPIERAISMYAMLVALNDENVRGKSFKDLIMRNNMFNENSRLTKFSIYPTHMQRWLCVLKRDQILIIDGHNFITNPSIELTKVEQFLQIGHFFTPERFMFNSTKHMYCIVKSGVPSCMDSKKGRPHPVISSDVRLNLQEYSKPLNEMFFKLIGKRFEWGY